LKSGKSGIQNQLDALKAKIERDQNDLKIKKGKISYRNTDEIDREIKYLLAKKPPNFRDLEREVDSGKLKLVDEKKNLKRISDLKAIRKQMATFTTLDDSIKADLAKRKALQDDLSSSTQTPEAKALSEEFSRAREELQKLKEENDDAFAKRGELRDLRSDLQKQRDKAYEAKKAVQDEYYGQRDAHRAWTDQNRKV
jgi:chromosome segregation ATPase